MKNQTINPRRGAVYTVYCIRNAHFSQTTAKLTSPASKQYVKKEGITLISLVVTIIILLILAGVTLALISGSDGILGRASHALDENKIAMAKEQVELVLSDFQAEFFDEKYVERTNNGTKKDYISEKLQAGVETTNFYAQASAEGNVTVYEGKDTSGTEVVKGTIQDDASIKWDDVKLGDSGENGGSSEGGNGTGEEGESGGSTGNVSSEELGNLKAQIAQLQGEVNNLKNKQQTTSNALDSILTSQTRKDILYEGTADTVQTYSFTFPEGKTLSDYKMLCFFTDAHWNGAGIAPPSWIAEQVEIVDAEVNDTKYRYVSSCDYDAWLIWFSINSPNHFRVDQMNLEGNYTAARIYKVIGIY